MTTDERLERIKGECEKQELQCLEQECLANLLQYGRCLRIQKNCSGGWRWSMQLLIQADGDTDTEWVEANLDLAELLLAATDPDAVRVLIQQTKDGQCAKGCIFVTHCKWAEYEFPIVNPGPSCPGPAPDGYEYVLVLMKVAR